MISLSEHLNAITKGINGVIKAFLRRTEGENLFKKEYIKLFPKLFHIYSADIVLCTKNIYFKKIFYVKYIIKKIIDKNGL